MPHQCYPGRKRRYQLWGANKANKAIIDIHNQGENTSLKLEPRGLKEGSVAIPCNRPQTSSPVLLLLTPMIRMYCTHKIKSFFVLQTFWTPAIHAFVITLEHSYRALKSIFNGQWTSGFLSHILLNLSYLKNGIVITASHPSIFIHSKNCFCP